MNLSAIYSSFTRIKHRQLAARTHWLKKEEVQPSRTSQGTRSRSVSRSPATRSSTLKLNFKMEEQHSSLVSLGIVRGCICTRSSSADILNALTLRMRGLPTDVHCRILLKHVFPLQFGLKNVFNRPSLPFENKTNSVVLLNSGNRKRDIKVRPSSANSDDAGQRDGRRMHSGA